MKTEKLLTNAHMELLVKVVMSRLTWVRNLKNERRPAEEKLLVEILESLLASRPPKQP